MSRPELSDIMSAYARLKGVANVTPVIRSRYLDSVTGCHVHLKTENFQRTGSFKFRGAYNAVSLLPVAERKRGVLISGRTSPNSGMITACSILTCAVAPPDCPNWRKGR